MTDKLYPEIVFYGSDGKREVETEKQPHRSHVRLFEYLTPSDKIKLDAMLRSKKDRWATFDLEDGREVHCKVVNMGSRAISFLGEGDSVEELDAELLDVVTEILPRVDADEGVLCASDVLSRLAVDLAQMYPDMEFTFTNVNCTNDVAELHTSNLIRICMLCADVANSVSRDRRFEIRLKRRASAIEMELEFASEDAASLCDDERISLARFVAEAENGHLDMRAEGQWVKFLFSLSAAVEEMPEFKFRDQFAHWERQLSSIYAEISSLNA